MILDSNLIIYSSNPLYPQMRTLVANHVPAASAVSKVEVLGYQKLTPESKAILEQFSRQRVYCP